LPPWFFCLPMAKASGARFKQFLKASAQLPSACSRGAPRSRRAETRVQIRFTNDDVEMLRNVVPLTRHISRHSQLQSTVQNGNRSFSFPVYGTDASIRDIWNLDMESGRFLNDQDNLSHGLYAVIGSEAKDKLFSGIPPVGETIRINGVSFQIVGVIQPRMQEVTTTRIAAFMCLSVHSTFCTTIITSTAFGLTHREWTTRN
jgi:hypothetical protein